MCHGGWAPEAALIERVLSLRYKIYRAFYTYTVLFPRQISEALAE